MGATEDGLIFDWNDPVDRCPELVDGLLRTPGMGPSEASATAADLARVGVRRFWLSGPAQLDALGDAAACVELTAEPAAVARLAEAARAGGARRGAIEAVFALGPAPRLAAAVDAARSEGWSASVRVAGDAEGLDERLRAAVSVGVERVVLEDAVGLEPRAAAAAVARAGAAGLAVDWCGENRTGLGVAAALAASEAGASRLYGTFLGIGAGSRPVPLDQVAVNLDLAGAHPVDPSVLVDVARAIAARRGWTVPRNYPVVGRDAFRTATGVHAAAIVKALAKGESGLADRIYSGVPAGRFGRRQVIDVGPMSGMSNVRHWLAAHGIEPRPELARAIYARAKGARRTLDTEELEAIISGYP